MEHYPWTGVLTGLTYTVWTTSDLGSWTPDSGALQVPTPDTPMADELRVTQEAGSEVDPKFLGRIPMRRVAAPEEIVQAMLWAASPENSFMTGQAIALDGGLTAT